MFTFIAFAAGLVRGYSGFGFAMLMALGLMLQLPPAEAVPVALILDVACSVTLWPAALRARRMPHRPSGDAISAGSADASGLPLQRAGLTWRWRTTVPSWACGSE